MLAFLASIIKGGYACWRTLSDGGGLTEVGDFQETSHGVAGKVFIKDEQTLVIQGFKYDDPSAPEAFFMAGKSGKPQQNGIPLPYQYQGKAQMTIQRLYLEAFFNGTVELTLDLDWDWDYDRDGPDGRINASELQWLSVWGNTTNVDFGHVMF